MKPSYALRKLFLIMLLICHLVSSAQDKKSVSPKGNPAVKYMLKSGSEAGSAAVIVDELPLAHTTQFLPVDKNGNLAGKGNPIKQLDQLFNNIGIALGAANSGIDDIVKINVCITQSDLMPMVQQYISGCFKKGKQPAVSFVTGDLAITGAVVAIDVIAVSGSLDKKIGYFSPDNLFGAAEQAQVAVLPVGSVVYVSGQAAKGAIAEAARATLKQLDSTLNHLGLKKEDIIQIKSFICPVTDINLVKKEIAGFFKGQPVPPTVYVEWVSKNPLIEIELVAAVPHPLQKKVNQLDFITPPGMTASPVYSKVTRINYGKKIYFSSIYGATPGDAKTEVRDIFRALEKIIGQSGSDFNHLVKATYYVSNDSTSNELNEIRPKYYLPDSPPAASKAKVKGVGLTGRGIVIDMIGIVKNK
jgi:enamine deaminase RidA (YjgF/YER057c/UK114 family)